MLHQELSHGGPVVCKGGRCRLIVLSPGGARSQNSDLSVC